MRPYGWATTGGCPYNVMKLATLIVCFLLFLLSSSPVWAINLDNLSKQEITTLEKILETLKPLIEEKKAAGTANLLTFEELYQPFSRQQKRFLDDIRAIQPEQIKGSSRKFSINPAHVVFETIGGQKTNGKEGEKLLEIQYLPKEIYQSYVKMMEAMERDIGKRLLVESGYRSAAYQLYLFVFYMPKHGYSIQETNRFVALPGCSEHGYPQQQAIDFINQEGINGEDNPEEFEVLPEYQWLTQHAGEYGFVLSYPRNNDQNTSFEPWHWSYRKK